MFVPAVVTRQTSSPQQIADGLLAADRTFSAAAAKTDLTGGLSAMFASDVVMPNPNGIAQGFDKAVEALKANPINTARRSSGRRRAWGFPAMAGTASRPAS
jgi:hypothetical protein